jgi:hypothetical protein
MSSYQAGIWFFAQGRCPWALPRHRISGWKIAGSKTAHVPLLNSRSAPDRVRLAVGEPGNLPIHAQLNIVLALGVYGKGEAVAEFLARETLEALAPTPEVRIFAWLRFHHSLYAAEPPEGADGQARTWRPGMAYRHRPRNEHQTTPSHHYISTTRIIRVSSPRAATERTKSHTFSMPGQCPWAKKPYPFLNAGMSRS